MIFLFEFWYNFELLSTWCDWLDILTIIYLCVVDAHEVNVFQNWIWQIVWGSTEIYRIHCMFFRDKNWQYTPLTAQPLPCRSNQVKRRFVVISHEGMKDGGRSNPLTSPVWNISFKISWSFHATNDGESKVKTFHRNTNWLMITLKKVEGREDECDWFIHTEGLWSYTLALCTVAHTIQ